MSTNQRFHYIWNLPEVRLLSHFWPVPILYSLETPKNHCSANVFRGYKMGTLVRKRLTLPVPILDNEEKINLNFYFHISLWCLKRFYESLKVIPLMDDLISCLPVFHHIEDENRTEKVTELWKCEKCLYSELLIVDILLHLFWIRRYTL